MSDTDWSLWAHSTWRRQLPNHGEARLMRFNCGEYHGLNAYFMLHFCSFEEDRSMFRSTASIDTSLTSEAISVADEILKFYLGC